MRFDSKWLLCVCLLLPACGGRTGPVVETGERYQAGPSQMERYQLGVGDKVRMTVFREETLSGEFSVTSSGMLSLPLVGDVPATGRTPDEVAVQVQTMLGNGYLRDPKVSMEIVTYRPFFILGEVHNPGQYPYTNGLTALNAIATAQGFTPRAARKLIFIRRAGSTEEQPFRLTPDLRIYPGDTVRLGERYF